MHGKNGLCMDDGGAMAQGEREFSAQPCNPNNQNQLFVYDRKTYQLRSARKNNLCVDDGNGQTTASSKFSMWNCDTANPNQVFMYNAAAKCIQSVKKQGLCIDDGGGQGAVQSQFVLWYCDPANKNQDFVYNPKTLLMRNPNKDNLCMDNGAAYSAGAGPKFTLWYCDVSNPNQHFEFILAPDPPTVMPPVKISVVPTDWETGGGLVVAPPTIVRQPMQPVDLTNDKIGGGDFVPKDTALPQKSDGSSGANGDWNMLLPSHATISHVNANKLTLITLDKIFQFLAKIKDGAEMESDVSKHKYARTFKCVSARFKSIGNDFVSEHEYHALVQWMFAHCAASNDDVGSSAGSSSNSTTPGAFRQNATDSSYMTKLEFYYEIKDHFTGHHETMFGSAAAAHLRLTLARTQEQKLADCIKAASVRFSIYGTENRDQHFETATAWVRDECAAV